MRRLFVCASACWAGHSLLEGSAFALTFDALTLAALLMVIWREERPSLPSLVHLSPADTWCLASLHQLASA